ncbi:MAG: asparagine synthase (glutamine-hydrolyzing) [Proteobacteria bacterium]|nr:asparagine synthase (glutamine-hydrolyzing) [Pseudomonadota bacterium]
MCGFAGLYQTGGKPVDTSVLTRMGAILRHRGPDDSGHDIAGPAGQIGFAFRRLSIIDLSSAGHQPMRSDDGQLCLVYNGEVYNAPELRRELEGQGVRFRGHSDTEVILRLYEVQGTRAFARLNGMFAIALWDGRQQRLHLVRDRIGIKPLYYARVGEAFVFASEIKALFCYPGMRRAFDMAGVADYVTYQFCLGERTVFEGVKLLSPATILSFDLDKPQAEPVRETFWRFQYRPDTSRTLADFAEELRARLEAALARQTRSDVPVGTFLSSGMDTGAISALAVRHLPGMHSFTCGFDTAGLSGDEVLYDERRDAQDLATLLGTQHHTLTLSQVALREYFEKTCWHMESPQVGISYQILAMAEVVRAHTTVVLSGTGGDELFAGYHWRYQGLLEEKNPAALDDAMYRRWNRLMDADTRLALLDKRLLSCDTRRGFDALMAQCDSDEALPRLLHFELHGFLHGLLQLDDKLNMAHSVEARVPLLDNEVLELAQAIPAAMKYDGENTKIVLKHALGGILPDAVIHRRKQGFTPPDASSMRGVNRAWVEGILFSEQLAITGLVKREGVDRIWAEHVSGAQNHRFLIWALLCLHAAQELYIEDKYRFFG